MSRQDSQKSITEVQSANFDSLQAEASSENTSPERLSKLAKINQELARLVAGNVASSPEILQELSNNTDRDAGVRSQVAKNPNTPATILEKLATDREIQL